jgi:hypothetical protein
MVVDRVPDEQGSIPQCWLYRCADRSPFAFSRGDDFIRWADHTRWARLCGDRLLSVESGECLADRVGGVFYDAVSHEPIYYQRFPAPIRGHHPFGSTPIKLAADAANLQDTGPRLNSTGLRIGS